MDFTDRCRIVKQGITELIKYHHCIAWLDFGDKGTPCYNPFFFPTRKAREEYALTHAAVEVELAKDSAAHLLLGGLVAKDIGGEWVTYDWLSKAVARILCGASIADLHSMLELSDRVKTGMKGKGLTTIHSIEEAL